MVSQDPSDNIGARYIDDASLIMGRRFGPAELLDTKINDSNIGDLKYGAAYTTPWNGINLSYAYYSKYPGDLRDLVRHEFGHILQARANGNTGFVYMAVSSFISAATDPANHQTNWTETTANALSYYYFGFPGDWNHSDYPVDSDYMFNKVVGTGILYGLGPK